jgi:putative membrane protein
MFKLLLKGFIIGIGKIIPGVSGAMLAISMGIYEKALKSIVEFFKDPIENFKFLFPIGIGALFAISLFSKLILYLLNNFYLSTILLFIGLIIGGIPPLFKKINKFKLIHFIIFMLSFSLVLILSKVSKNNTFIISNNIFTYFIIGSIDAITMIIPGISGTAVMMILGVYDILLEILSNINLSIINNLDSIIPFVLGIIITILLLSKLINYLFVKKEELMYTSIIGFVISSVVILFSNILNNRYSLNEIFISIILFFIGIFVSVIFDKKN